MVGPNGLFLLMLEIPILVAQSPSNDVTRHGIASSWGPDLPSYGQPFRFCADANLTGIKSVLGTCEISRQTFLEVIRPVNSSGCFFPAYVEGFSPFSGAEKTYDTTWMWTSAGRILWSTVLVESSPSTFEF